MWRNILYQPFAPENQPYDFAPIRPPPTSGGQHPHRLQTPQRLQTPVESILIDRMVAGHYWMLKRLGVKADFRPLLEEYIKRKKQQNRA